MLAILLSFFLRLAAFLTSRKEALSCLAEVLLSSPDVLLDDMAVPSSTIVLAVCKSIETCLCKDFTPTDFMMIEHTQGAGRVVDLPKNYTDTNSCIFWCKMTLGTTFTKGVLPVVGEPKSKKN